MFSTFFNIDLTINILCLVWVAYVLLSADLRLFVKK